jgi:signal transduction histidine kinase/FixJ family two-component response regulator
VRVDGLVADDSSVLVVDDDAAMRETLVEILSRTGIAAEGVPSAAAARACQEEHTPAVALVDQNLPDATGVELGSSLKAQDSDVSVVLVTGYASLENAIAAVADFDGYLTKPVPPAELVRVVRAGIERARLRRENRSLVGELQEANARLETSVADRTRELSGLRTMAEALAGSSELDRVVDACLAAACQVTGACFAKLRLREGDAEVVTVAGAADPAIGETAVPLAAGGIEVGTLVLGDPAEREPMFLATLAATAAVAIQNAQRFGRERETVERLSELSRMKTTFLATVSHELRTPLAAMVGLAEMLCRRLDTATSERRREMLEQILDQGRRLGLLIDDLLDATRVEFGGLRVQRVAIDLRRVTARVERSFAAAPGPLVVELPTGLPPAVGDEVRLEQVLSNLAANAFKHSPRGAPVTIVAEPDGDHVRIAVVDFGSGIEPEFLRHVFEPFAQAADTGARQEGLGLGLYISRGLVEAMGGGITAESRPGEGSRFVVQLERAVNEVVAAG